MIRQKASGPASMMSPNEGKAKAGLQGLSPFVLVLLLWAVQSAVDVFLSFVGVGGHREFFTIAISRSVELVFALLLAWVNGRLLRTPSLRNLVVISVLVCFASVGTWWLDALLQAINNGKAFTADYISGLRFNIGYFTAVFVLQTVAVALLESVQKIAAREGQLAAARHAAQQAVIAALRFQLDPHFLFNTMNAIAALVAEGENKEAEAMIGRLCDFLRSTLTTSPGSLHSLDVELEIVSHYLEIEGYRFGDRLLVHYDCAPELRDALVPGMILQPLIENAIKYGVRPSIRPVTITIRVESSGSLLHLLVEDDGSAGAGNELQGTQVGLKNVRDRLASLYGEQGVLRTVLRTDGFSAMLQLPYQHAAETGGQQ